MHDNFGFRSAFGPISQRLGLPLQQVDVAWLGTRTAALKPLGVTPARAAALFFIEHNPGCSQTRVGDALRINRLSTVRAVDELVALGAIERQKVKASARDNALFLTAFGKDLHGRIDTVTFDHETEFFAPLTVSERTRFRALLLKLL